MTSSNYSSHCQNPTFPRIMTIAIATVMAIVVALAISGCGSENTYTVSGTYSSTSTEGITVSVEFNDGKMRLSSDYNTGPWRSFKRNGNTLTVKGLNSDGSSATLTIDVLSDSKIRIENFVGNQDVTFTKK